jgi:hypothetical protein
MSLLPLVRNICNKCGCDWVDHPGVWALWPTCPNCGGLYWVAVPIDKNPPPVLPSLDGGVSAPGVAGDGNGDIR